MLSKSAEGLRALGGEAGIAATPDDLLVAAASCGATASPPFLDILDGGGFARAVCLCCYAAHHAAAAREAAAALHLFQQYYNASSYLSSRAFIRTVVGLARDARSEEVAEVKAHVAALDATPDSVRALNAIDGLCVAVPICRPGVVWVYSTAMGRRLLRHLARGLRRGGAPVRVTVASSDPLTHPRFRYRMYAVSLLRAPSGAGSAGGSAADTGALLGAALTWARARPAARR